MYVQDVDMYIHVVSCQWILEMGGGSIADVAQVRMYGNIIGRPYALKELSHEIEMGCLWYGWKEAYLEMNL
jgi:hypothetical protein